MGAPFHLVQLQAVDHDQIMFALIATINQRLNALERAPSTTNAVISRPPTHAEAVRTFQYLPAVKEMMRRTACKIFLAEDVHAYAMDNHKRSLFCLVMVQIDQHPTEYKRVNFPSNYATGDGLATLHLQTKVQKQTKNV
ncbi:hypothetical protein H4Q26_014882 [Puccinia striiformis f. sp. tritici PST-130]|nr:hypothetical protein H4Q26_014882 [Puccinia striiformis f. sp. tritici PST-130]